MLPYAADSADAAEVAVAKVDVTDSADEAVVDSTEGTSDVEGASEFVVNAVAAEVVKSAADAACVDTDVAEGVDADRSLDLDRS
jgi:hypothetical protein